MKKKLVHVVEDEEDISKLIEYNLLSQGFNVVCSENGDVALKSIKEEKGDLVLLDIMLPGIDGYRVCEIIKSNDSTRDLPIIMLTAKSQEEEIVKGLEMGADDYITKPFSQKVLIARVQNVLRRSANQLISEDEINRKVYQEVYRQIKKDPSMTEALSRCGAIAKFLERISDYSTNIAEDVIYMVDAKIVRHKPESLM